MAECLAQLTTWIQPPTMLPIALPVALSTVTAGDAVEAAKVGPGTSSSVPSVTELVWTPASMKITLISTKMCSKMALRDKC
jgi:hypothetical protein